MNIPGNQPLEFYQALLNIILLLPKGKSLKKRNMGDLLITQFVTREQFNYLGFSFDIISKVFETLESNGILKKNNSQYDTPSREIEYFEILTKK